MSVSHLTPDEAERPSGSTTPCGRPPTATSAASPRSWPPSPTTNSSGRPSSRSATCVHKIGAKALETALDGAEKRGYRGSSLSCPECRESARFVGYRPKVRAEPPGDHPPGAGLLPLPPLRPGHDPLGRTAGPRPPRPDPRGRRGRLPRRRPGQLRRGRLLGAAEDGRPVGLGIDRGAGERGGRPGHRPAAWPRARPSARRSRGRWHKDAEGKTCAYVALDLTGLGMQGPGAAAAPGRMAAVGMVYNPVPERPAQWADPDGPPPRFQARYVAGLGRPGARWASRCGSRRPRWAWTRPSGGSPSATRARAWRTCWGRTSAAGRGGDPRLLSRHGIPRRPGPGPVPRRRGRPARSGSSGWCHRLKHEGGPAVLEDAAGDGPGGPRVGPAGPCAM